jgi:hypothetical protein
VRAGRFETRHPTLLHLLVVGASWATYLVDREDIVWWMIRASPSRRLLEHILFGITAVLIGAGAVLCTRARVGMHSPYGKVGPGVSDPVRTRLLGEWLYAVGLATLLPLSGCILLVSGESIRIVRLAIGAQELPPPDAGESGRSREHRWTRAIRRESVKWGIFATMIVFSVCLVDRVADYGILASLFAWALLCALSAL